MRKILYLILIAVMPLLADASLQKVENLASVKMALKDALKSDNNGTQNSALYVLSRLKSDLPEEDLQHFNALLKNIANTDDDYIVRQNASLTFAYINSPILVNTINVDKEINPNKFFALLSRELNKEILAYTE